MFSISQRTKFRVIYAQGIHLLLSHEYTVHLASESMMLLNKIYHFWEELINLQQLYWVYSSVVKLISDRYRPSHCTEFLCRSHLEMQCMITNLLTYLTERAALYSGEVDVKQGQEVFFWKICQWGQSLMPWRLILVEIFLAFVYLLDIYKWLYI